MPFVGAPGKMIAGGEVAHPVQEADLSTGCSKSNDACWRLRDFPSTWTNGDEKNESIFFKCSLWLLAF